MPSEHSGAWSFKNGLHGLNLSSDGDAERFLHRYGARVLVARQKDDHSEVYILDRMNGLWSRDFDLFLGLHQASIDFFLREYLAARTEDELLGFTPAERRKAATMINDRKEPRSCENMRKAIGALVQQIIDHSVEETVSWWYQITICDAEDIDADMSSIAAPNGVIDLKSGALLSSQESRRRLCTKAHAIPDPYRPNAMHTDVPRLFDHMPTDHGKYFFDEFGYSLHGQPTRRFLMIISPPNSGKSTLVDAITYSLGPLVKRASNTALARTRGGRDDPDPSARKFTAPTRLTIMEEVEKIKVSEDILKERTGDSAEIPVRMLHSNPVEERPTATPVLLGNNPPQSLGLSDPGVLQRCKPLPYTPLPPDKIDPGFRYAFSPRDKREEAAREAQRRRQALIATLVQAAVTYQPGNPPLPPHEVTAIIQSWEDDELGDIGRWLIDSLTPEPEASVVIDHVWEQMVETFGQDKEGKVQGWIRSTLAKRIKTMLPTLPPATRHRATGRKREWEGWRFAPVVDYDESDYNETAKTDTSPMFS